MGSLDPRALELGGEDLRGVLSRTLHALISSNPQVWRVPCSPTRCATTLHCQWPLWSSRGDSLQHRWRPAMRRLSSSLILLSAFAWPARGQVLTAQQNNARTGADTTETRLTPRNVNARQFGHLFRIPADGDVYAQPLVMPKLRLGGGRIRDALIIATEHGTVEAWDADSATTHPLWRISFVRPEAGVTAIPNRDLHCPFIKPEVSITCTPAIDAQNGTIYVL